MKDLRRHEFLGAANAVNANAVDKSIAVTKGFYGSRSKVLEAWFTDVNTKAPLKYSIVRKLK